MTKTQRVLSNDHHNEYKHTQKINALHINALRLRQNDRHFPDIFKWVFLNEKIWTSIKSSLKFVPKDPIKNIPALVKTMAWRRPGDKPLSESMVVRLTTHINNLHMYNIATLGNQSPNLAEEDHNATKSISD